MRENRCARPVVSDLFSAGVRSSDKRRAVSLFWVPVEASRVIMAAGFHLSNGCSLLQTD